MPVSLWIRNACSPDRRAGTAAYAKGNSGPTSAATQREGFPFPYPEDGLAPAISPRTIEFHHDKLHQAYVRNTNSLVEKTEFATVTLEEIIKKTAGNPERAGLCNHAAQVWNHTFYWKSMKPGSGGHPAGVLAKKLEDTFGGFDNFKKEFASGATNSQPPS